jgi:hypothetical protein
MTNNILQNTTNPTQTWEENSCAPEGSTVPAQHVTRIPIDKISHDLTTSMNYNSNRKNITYFHN